MTDLKIEGVDITFSEIDPSTGLSIHGLVYFIARKGSLYSYYGVSKELLNDKVVLQSMLEDFIKQDFTTHINY